MIFNKAVTAKAFLSLILTLFAVSAFQNCSPVRFTKYDNAIAGNNTQQDWCTTNPTAAECVTQPVAKCIFNGTVYSEGAAVTAYLSSTGTTCQSEQRICKSGAFTGSYAYASCTPSAPASCLFNGQTIASGSTVKAYQNSSVAFGSTCQSENRLCTNGVLAGSFAYSTCAAGSAASCLFNGQTISHGSSVIAYPNSSVAFGSVCSSETRTCYNGALSGSANYASCTVGSAASCLFNGQTIAHGASVTGFLNSSVGYGAVCSSQTRTCNNGALSGSYNFASCTAAGPAACSFNGATIASGQVVKAYQNSSPAYPGQCVGEDRLCTNGNLSGSYNYASCNAQPGANCQFGTKTISHGSTVKAYLSTAVPFGQTCSSQDRTCTNGVLSGNYTAETCAPQGAASCTFNGKTIAHDAVVAAYQTSSVAYGKTCNTEQRKCSNGTLSGTYTNASCSVGAPVACTFNGVSVAHGAEVSAYLSSTVPSGQTCSTEKRKCDNGSLSGTYTNSSCTVLAASCLFNGQTIASGQKVKAFQNSTVAYDKTCSSEDRLCTNGSLSGSFNYATCSPAAPASCQFNGQSIAHGQAVTAYEDSSPVYGQSCVSEKRTCTNGVLSGSKTYASCTVGQPSACQFNGQTVAHGQTVNAYAASSVAYGSQCSTEVRTCNNGSLNGSYGFGSCTVNQPASCSFAGRTLAHGESVTAYAQNLVAYGQSCSSVSSTLQCSNGSMSGGGKYPYLSCSAQNPNSCNFNGQTIGHGQTVTAYAAWSVAYNQDCSAQGRYCDNGNLSGSYGASSCSKQAPPSCGGQRIDTMCTSYDYCPNGSFVGTGITGVPTQWNLSGPAGTQVVLQVGHASSLDGSLMYLAGFGGMQFRCDPSGNSASWTQLNGGACIVRRNLSSADYRCAIYTGGGGGGNEGAASASSSGGGSDGGAGAGASAGW